MQERTILDTRIAWWFGPLSPNKVRVWNRSGSHKITYTLDFEAMILQKNAYSGTNDGENLIDRSYEWQVNSK